MQCLEIRSDQYAKDYNRQKLLPIKQFIEPRKINGKLILSDADKTVLENLIYHCIGVKVSFNNTGLSYLEILDLAISPFINASHDRAELLCTTAGALRNTCSNTNLKLNANNRFHAMLIAVKNKVIEII